MANSVTTKIILIEPFSCPNFDKLVKQGLMVSSQKKSMHFNINLNIKAQTIVGINYK